MIMRGAAFAAACVLLSHAATAQDLSRYRDLTFGSSVAAVTLTTRTGPGAIKALHQRPALIQEMSWRPQYSLVRYSTDDAAQEVLLRFYNDQLSSIDVIYEARLVEGMTNQDMIAAVSSVYGSAAVAPAAKQGPVPAPPGRINGSTVLARWSTLEYEFTLAREAYPATFRLTGIFRRLDALATTAAAEAVVLDKAEAPQRESARLSAEAERRKAADEQTRTTNKGRFRP